MTFRYALIAICIAALVTAGCTAPASVAPVSRTIPAESAVVTTIPAAVGTTSGCATDVCTFVPSLISEDRNTSLRLEASPQRYSPLMSSTPGILLVPHATGFNVSSAAITWNTSYGKFLSWNPPDYSVNQRESTVTGYSGTLYWTFIDKPATPAEPVVIIARAEDPATGALLGSSTVTLAWDGNYSVTVQDIR